MVDVSAKTITSRIAVAATRVRFPIAVADALRLEGMRSAKGPVIDTAIIAGTMAVKRTHELIPFCHPLPIDGCRFTIDWADARTLEIVCEVRTTHRTGVEMEALTGASVAALTVYDMCKALSHAIVIGPTKPAVGKQRGGKHDVGKTSADACARVLYFASLRDAAGCAREMVEADSLLLSDLYDHPARNPWIRAAEALRVAVNGAFAGWGDTAADGDDVAFIPPVSGR